MHSITDLTIRFIHLNLRFTLFNLATAAFFVLANIVYENLWGANFDHQNFDHLHSSFKYLFMTFLTIYSIFHILPRDEGRLHTITSRLFLVFPTIQYVINEN